MAITKPAEYYALLHQLKDRLEQKTLLLIKGTAPLDDIKPDTPWPDDIIEHTFQCTQCRQRFLLSVETYHGTGGTWEAV